MTTRFSEKWLETLCSFLPGVHSAVFLVPETGQEKFHLLARWPFGLNSYKDFFVIVKYALKQHGAVCLPKAHVVDGEPMDYFAKPVYIDSDLVGVISIKMKHLPKDRHKEVSQSLKRSIKWLGLAGHNDNDLPVESANDADNDFYSNVVSVLASCFEQEGYQQGIIRMVAELTSHFKCERVAFAEMSGKHCNILALSNSADFDERSNLVRRIADAMDESVEQDQVILFPDSNCNLIQRAHQRLVRKHDLNSVATIPLAASGKIFGAITLIGSESAPLNEKSLVLCQQILSLLTPFLELKREQERSPLATAGKGLLEMLQGVFGFNYLKTKIAVSVLAMFVVMAGLVETDYRITANAILEGEIQRVVAAPISGYLQTSAVRAGDTIREGQVMVSLDDTQLNLEMAKLNGQLQKSRREHREAQSTRDLVRVRVIREQINQILAEIDLVEQQLDNIHLAAPFDGVVIEGDLSQSLGAPVERGETLFKIAPLDDYRIILKVNERQIAYVEPGQEGSLTLSSLSSQSMPIRVERITSVTKAEDGANHFRVEASLPEARGALRPGMEGIAKVNAGQERLLWIWTHEMIDWFRLWVWSWWP